MSAHEGDTFPKSTIDMRLKTDMGVVSICYYTDQPLTSSPPTDMSELSLSLALTHWMKITDPNVAEVKKMLNIEISTMIQGNPTVANDPLCDSLFKAWDVIPTRMPKPPRPDGTRSSKSKKAMMFDRDKETQTGIIIWTNQWWDKTPKNEVWVVMF